MRKVHRALRLMVLLMLVGCGLVQTGDKASDATAAERFLPNIEGYNSAEATDILDAVTKSGASASLVTGNIPLAGTIAKLNDLVQCYKGVGAVAARIYTEKSVKDITSPKIGVLAVINTTRIQRNLLSCALSFGSKAQADGTDSIQPCGGSGSIVVNNETIQYVFGATAPELCTVFQGQFKQ